MQSSLFPTQSNNLLPFQGEMLFFPEFFPKPKADQYLSQLIDSLEWRQEPIWMFGKQVMQPRMTALYGDPKMPYGYSGIRMTPLSWTSELREILEEVQGKAETVFTHVLCNYYRDGKDSMGWHRDNEKVLGENPTIASVTFGAERIFQTRPYAGKKPKIDIQLTHGSLLLMRGESQQFWEHQLPKTKSCLQGRINLTFRRLV
ncbi:alpha-ketoglutarate-dependent dioxygenase AlkB family protein [Algoriphagus confluentis]|uniref:Alpha-ketoglutarate-dependent dioxygenase AlkB n=1 Tax=Algoriphagus confluentis TaxID=1697556 RepID=A0ABQ6PP27_9BACT|nr:alpha-ketoglutarate-dependent dioxygenase AlkB [Algoriphagus confluentis]